MFSSDSKTVLNTPSVNLTAPRSTTPSAASSTTTTTTRRDYDLVVIGGGSGGLSVSKEAAILGAKVALFDFVSPSPQGSTWGLGGTCVNVGCMPKKMMHVAALAGRNIKDSASFGWFGANPGASHNWPKLVNNVQERIKGSNWVYKVALRTAAVTYYNAKAEFVDKHTVKATDKDGVVTEYSADKIVIAVGGRPIYPDNVPGAKEFGITSDDVFSLKNHPGKTLVVGASYIALETAGFLAGLGVDVTVMVRSILLRGFDRQMAELVGTYMEEEGVKFQKGKTVVSIEHKKNASGPLRTLIVKSKGAAEEFNTVMFATGRYPVTQALKLDRVGVNVDGNGFILANESDVTSVSNIYAIGDCVQGRPELTPAAVQAGLLLARRLYGQDRLLVDYTNCPTVIFTPLEYGCVGVSEEAAKDKWGEKDLEVYHSYFQPFESQLSGRDQNKGYVKVICRKSDNERVVGMHYLGPNAGEVMQGFGVAMRLGAKKDDLNATIGIHPTSAENFTITLKITKSSGKDAMKKGCCG